MFSDAPIVLSDWQWTNNKITHVRERITSSIYYISTSIYYIYTPSALLTRCRHSSSELIFCYNQRLRTNVQYANNSAYRK